MVVWIRSSHMIIAVNYEAREFGVTRSMRGDEARKKCPDIILVHVPEVRGKADLSKYRDAGREVVDVFCQFSECVQRASVDEAYIDITESVEQRINNLYQVQPSHLPTTFVVGSTDIDSNDEDGRQRGLVSWLENIYELQDTAQQRLAVAGIIVEEMRTAVFRQTGFRCSAGISHNKILGKLACGLHKPNRQTILPPAGVMDLYKTLPVRKVRNLGGKFGCVVVEQLGCKVMADLLQFTERQLQQQFHEKMGTWLYNIARGIDSDPVTKRLVSKSVGCCKKFPGRQALTTKTDVQFWLSELSAEVAERLAKDLIENKRRAKLLTVSYHQDINSDFTSSSRSGPLTSYDPQRIQADAFELVKKSNTGSVGGPDVWNPPLVFLGLSVGKFVDEGTTQSSTIHDFFKATQKESSKDGSKNVTELKKVVDDNTDGADNHCIMQVKECGEIKPLANLKNSCEVVSDMCKASSTSKSFFMKYLKQHSIATCAETNIDQPISKSVLDPDSDDDLFESPVTDMETPKEEKSSLLSTTTRAEFNLGASTSLVGNQVDDDTTEMWVSLTELFPDISKADDDVVALLPTPLQKRVQAQIEKAKHDSNVSSKHVSANLTSDDTNMTHTSDSWLVGGHTQAETDRATVSYVPLNHGDEAETSSASHCKTDTSHAYLVTSVTPSICEESNAENNQNVVCETCPQCRKDVPLSEYAEHLDFHAAEKLHKELNGGSVHVRTAVTTSTLPKNPSELPTKRKRGRLPRKLSVTDCGKKMRSITTFFAPK
ncbi:DNA polymerase eta isoform X2 [Zootermopsis nevadensis]|uniref:DNA polymerase eta isoform X2 n=1 Tax=Zootermopsis nevadensis TaxID=136037 RepID=UPI000B8E4E52|nr:DNA polymerase eta isoform X2 [Zootermopsis nevadensis]